MKFHITMDGEINACVMSPCPFADRPHYWSPEQAVMARVALAAAGRVFMGTIKD